jgi:CHAD domain-containing protein
MSYRLRIREGLATGVRRIAREQLEGALREIAVVTTGDEAAAVHATRKYIKKTRALLRLIRAEIGPEIFKAENRYLREVARGFSGPRDARVELQLLQKLREQAQLESMAFAQTAALLQEEVATHVDSFGPQQREAEATLQRICDRIEGWPLDDLGIDDLCCALRSSYRCGRKCFRRVQDEATSENFHSWRRRVKDIWYQARLLQNLNAAALGEINQAARTLGQMLGDLHDLAFFRIRLEAEPGIGEEERSSLLELIGAGERELEEITLDLGARFFIEKPRALERRLLRYARDWPVHARLG